MNGGDKILTRIKSDCDESIRKAELEAQKVCDGILEQAKQDAELAKKEIADKNAAKSAQITAMSKSRCELEIKNAILKKRRQEIDLTVEKLLEYLTELNDKEYFDIIYALGSKLSGKSGDLLMNQRDLSRLPSDFSDRMKAVGLEADVKSEPVDILGGFILKSGDIEENMSFSAIISANRDNIEDLINRELFAE